MSVETVVPDREEHRRRVERRVADIPGHEVPTWDQVQHGEWSVWDEARDGHRLLVDTTDAASAVALVLGAVCSPNG